MASVELTSDSWDLIVDVLGDELAPDHTSLKALALTCKAMVFPCRKQLFSTIHLTDMGAVSLPKLIGRFHKLITHAPAIIQYVRRLVHVLDYGNDVRLHQIFEMLCSSTILSSITLWGRGRYWNSLPRRFQIALENVIQLPTVTTLSLSSIQAFPDSIFFGSSSLTHITLEDVKSSHISDSNVSVGRAIYTLRPIYLFANPGSYDCLRLRMQSSGSESGADVGMVDFSRLRSAEFFVDYSADVEFVTRVLHMSSVVESLVISADDHQVSLAGLGKSLSESTLRKFKVDTFVISEDGADPLCDLLPELGMLAGKNILEEVTLTVTFCSDVRRLADTDDWAGFDSLLTTPGSFPMLRVVKVIITWYISDPESGTDSDDDEERIPQAEMVNQVTESKFPKLRGSLNLEFRFSTEVFEV